MFIILYDHSTYGTCLCDVAVNGKAWCYTYTEAQAQQRVADLATIGINARYERATEEDKNHLHQLQTW